MKHLSNRGPSKKTLDMHIDNTEILRLLRNPEGKERGFRLLMKQYGESIYWHIRRIVVGHDDAEDVLQETTIKIFKNIERFAGDKDQLKAWIYRIATNESIMQLRRHKRFYQSIDSLSPALMETMMTENALDMNKAEDMLQRKLLTLPTQQRIVFNMRYYDDMSYEEIARVTGKRVGTLKTTYHFARQKIEEELKTLSL